MLGCCKGDNCDEDCPEKEGFDQIDGTSFYFLGRVGYDFSAQLGISTRVDGIPSPSSVLQFAISDETVFDNDPPDVELPNTQAILDSVKFSPQSDAGMLRHSIFIEFSKLGLSRNLFSSCLFQLLLDARRNSAFKINIPVLDTSFRKVFEIGKVFTNKLFRYIL